MQDTSVSLIERLQMKDPGAWERLLNLYQPWLFRGLRHFGLQEADANDLVQETLLVVVRELPGFEHNQRRGAFRSWLRIILANRVKQWLRDQHRQQVGLDKQLDELVDPDSNLSREWESQHDEYVSRRVLEMIRPDFQPATWQAFWRTVIEDIPAATVAAELGLSVNAVCIAKCRIVARFRQEMQGLVG